MATRILMVHNHLVRYQRQNSRYLPFIFRFFSNQKRDLSEIASNCQNPSSKVEDTDCEPVSKWLNIKAGILGPNDLRFQLPGDIGIPRYMKAGFDKRNAHLLELLFNSLAREDILQSMAEQDHNTQMALENLRLEMVSQLFGSLENYDKFYELEFKSHSCPKVLKKDFQLLFPDRDLDHRGMCVLTMCQKTKHDMSGWSEDVEIEREFLMRRFVECAQYICRMFKAVGFWADFIDPSSGRPVLGPFTSSTFFETDERFRHFGLRIEDLGCCRVITHPVWRKNVFVGSIFTDLPNYIVKSINFSDLFQRK